MKKKNRVFSKYVLSFKEVILILGGKILKKLYAQYDLDLYSRICGHTKWDIDFGEQGRGSTEKARTKLFVSTKSVKMKSEKGEEKD